jgi:hypothetical protein
MFDWDEKLGKKVAADPRDPLALFESLDRKATHTILRPVQQEALELLRDRQDERDLVMKLSTGAGKTTIGLVYLYACMRASQRPAVYLCPTTQLVAQVLGEAQNLGIPAVEYPKGQPHPGVDALHGEAIVVCTYDKLFNAKTTFERHDVQLHPYAIVLDDAHAGIEEVRESFTLAISASGNKDAYEAVLKELEPVCAPFMLSTWAFIKEGKFDSAMEVPYWLWATITDRVRAAIDPHVDDPPFCFVWPYLRDLIRWCRCVVSGAGIEIVPLAIPVDLVPPYDLADRRLYMSATLSDDSALVRDLACSAAAALNPIVPPSDAGVGERMVLAPTLIDPELDRSWVMQWCSELAKGASVVVLSSSEKHAREWIEHGAEIVLGGDVDGAVQELKRKGTKARGLVAFAQRYDGVDLPDDACRVLVLDGMPQGSGIVETLDHEDIGRPGGALEKWVHRVEQGMGRAVRSHADFAVVILAGQEITHFVARADVRERLGDGTRAQLDLARELMKMVQEAARDSSTATAVKKMAQQCLGRDAGWKKFYDQKVRKTSRIGSRTPNEHAIRLAEAEREAFDNARANDAGSAAEIIDRAITAHVQGDTFKGWFMQEEANYLFAANPERAIELQRQAFKKNRKLLLPPSGVQVRRPAAERLVAPAVVQAWLSKFAEGNGAIVEFHMIRSKLSFAASTDQFEQGMLELADLIGAGGSRPEKEFGRGPDDLWEWPDADWVIECKTERQHALPKGDGEQLLAAEQWHKETAPERKCVPVVVSRIVNPEPDAYFPDGTRVITPEKLDELLANVERFVAELGGQLPLFRSVDRIREALRRHHLNDDEFANRYTVPLGRRRTRPR